MGIVYNILVSYPTTPHLATMDRNYLNRPSYCKMGNIYFVYMYLTFTSLSILSHLFVLQIPAQ